MKIDRLGENLLLHLHKMQDDIGNKCHSFWHHNNILRASQKIFRYGLNLLELTLHSKPRSPMTRAWKIDLITLLLASYASSYETRTVPEQKSNIAHKHFSMTYEIPNLLKGIVSSTLPLAWKVAILQKQNRRSEVETLYKRECSIRKQATVTLSRNP